MRICGVGYNDMTKYKMTSTPCYKIWVNMIHRCYSGKFSAYDKTLVCQDWLMFSNFKHWFDENYVEGFHLDKDLLKPTGRKMYSPNNCCFIPQELNSVLAKRKDKWVGVKLVTNGYQARVRLNGKQKVIGVYATKLEAKDAYRVAKKNHILSVLRELRLEYPEQTKLLVLLDTIENNIDMYVK